MERWDFDRWIIRFMSGLAFLTSLIAIIIVIVLMWKSFPLLQISTIQELLLRGIWQPFDGEFGFFPFIMGTIWVTLLAMGIAMPLALFSAIFLAEYSSGRIRESIKTLIDLLAGIPSVLFGLWGILVLVPLVRDTIAPMWGVSTTGYCVLTGGIVLSIMVLPLMISLGDELFRMVPLDTRKASFSLGATKWQTVKYVLIRKTFPGLLAVIILGFSRAFGETMAVLMVVGNVAKVPTSVFDPAYPLTALIANNYGEMLSIPLFDSAIMMAALILFIIVVIFNILSKVLLIRIQKAM